MGSRKSAGSFGATALVLLFISGAALFASARQSAAPQPHPVAAFAALPGSFSLIIEPQDGMVPVERMIESASSSIDLVMYEFEDAQLEALLAQRAKEGIAVRVILDNGYFGAGSSANEQAFDYLRSSGVSVHWSPGYFALTHQKTLIVDNKDALIMTFNFSPQYYRNDRDFGVEDPDPNDAAAIERAFDSDWNGQNAAAQNGDDLVWSPASRPHLLSLINAARASLHIYNEEMQDPQIIAALEAAAKRGVDVEIVMTYASGWKSAFAALSDSGVRVRTYAANAPLYIHAKMIIADGAEAFVGSENFSSTSLDQNRELGIILSDQAIVARLARVFAADWGNATPLRQ